MKRKAYLTPTMRFVQLQQRHHLLTGSIPEKTSIEEMEEVEEL